MRSIMYGKMMRFTVMFFLFFFNYTATTEIYTLSLHDALPICKIQDLKGKTGQVGATFGSAPDVALRFRSEEHTSELQSLRHLVCRLLLEKKKLIPKSPV